MTLERLQVYRNELLAKPSKEWAEVLFRLVAEAEGMKKDWKDRDNEAMKREKETLKLKLNAAISALEIYARPGSFTTNEDPTELAHLAQTTLHKIDKVTWLQEHKLTPVRAE